MRISAMLVIGLALTLATTATADDGINRLTVQDSNNTQGVTDAFSLYKNGWNPPGGFGPIPVDIDAEMEAGAKAAKIAQAFNDYRYNNLKQFNASASSTGVVTVTDTNGNPIDKIKFTNNSKQRRDTSLVSTTGGTVNCLGTTEITGTACGLNPQGQRAVFNIGARCGGLQASVSLWTDEYASIGEMLDFAASELQAEGFTVYRVGDTLEVEFTGAGNDDYFEVGTDDDGIVNTHQFEVVP